MSYLARSFRERHAVGLALVFQGLPLAWVARKALRLDPAGEGRLLVWLVMALGLFLMPGYMALLRGKIKRVQPIYLTPVAFLVLSLVLALSSPNGSTFDVLYTGYVLVLFFLIVTVPLNGFRHLPNWITLLGVLACSLVLFQNSYTHGLSIGRVFAGDSQSPNQFAFVAGLTFVAAWYLLGFPLQPLGIRQWWLIIGLTISSWSMVLANTRSVFIGVALVGLLAVVSSWRWYEVIFSRFKWRMLARIVMLSVVIGAIMLFTHRMWVPRVTNVSKYIFRGFESYVYGIHTGEESSQMRRDLLLLSLKKLATAKPQDFLLGYGYKALYIDFPLLQAFYDLGFVGGMWFFTVTVLMPAYLILSSMKYGTGLQRFAGYVYVYFFPNLILHGQPYDYPIWIPLALLYGISGRDTRGVA